MVERRSLVSFEYFVNTFPADNLELAPLLGIPPSFMLSGVVPGLYATIQAIVDFLPTIPAPSAELELPLSIVDGFTRAYLLCNLIPPAVTANASPLISSSPWTLLVTSLVF